MAGYRIAFALCGTLFLGAVRANAALQTSSWINYVDQNLQTVDQYGRGFEAISVFSYDFDVNGNLGPARPWVDSTLATLRADTSAPRRLIYVTVTNDIESNPPVNFSGDLIDSILRDPSKRAAHIAQLAALSAKADGIDIDYEALHAKTHDLFTVFIKELRDALPAGKKLAVTAQPKMTDTVGARGQAIDWRAIAPFVDVLRVMTYYYAWSSSPPGPSAPIAQTQALTRFALSEVPAAKLSIVLTLFGWDWPAGGGGRLISYQQALNTASRFGATPLRDATDQYLRFNYTDAGGVAHQIWIDDNASLQAKVAAIQGAGANRIDFWSLGSGDPNFLNFISSQSGSGPTPSPASAPSISSVNPSSATAGGPSLTLTINGSNFTTDSIARWNGSVRAATFVNASRMSAAISSADIAAPGTVAVSVSNSTGVSNTQAFSIAAAPPPSSTSTVTITTLTPLSAVAGGTAFNLTVDGVNFTSGSMVRYNGVDHPGVRQGTTRLIVYVSAADIAAPKTVPVTVFTPGSGLSNALTFTVTGSASSPAPSIATLTPSSAAAGGAAFPLIVNGGNFVSGSAVQWNGGPRPTTFLSATRLSVAISAGDMAFPGTAAVTVFTPAPGGGPSNTAFFTIASSETAPTSTLRITSLSPNSTASAGSAFNLTVDGANFTSGSTVRWNGASRPGVLQGTTRLIVYIGPADIAAPGTVSVAVFAPGNGLSNTLPFTVTGSSGTGGAPNPEPTITALWPKSATAGGGAFNLTVDGSQYVKGAVVRWNGLNRPGVLQGSTRLIVYIPASDIARSTTAGIVVVNPTPGGGVSNALPFDVSAPAAPALRPLAAEAVFSLRDLYAFPNPSRRGQPVTIRLQAGVADSVDVRVYDLAGRLVGSGSPDSPKILDDGNGKGLQFTYDYVWDVANIGSGVYIYSIRARKSGEAEVRKLGKVGVLK